MKKADKIREIKRYKDSVSFHNDGYRNMLNKVGTAQDNSTAWQYYADEYNSDLEMTHIYETNGLFAKIVNRPAEDAMAKGLDLEDLGEEIMDKVNKKLTKLHFVDNMIKAEKWSRLYGGAIAVLLVDDGRGLDEPLSVKRARSIEEIRVFERAIVSPDYTGLYNYSFYDPDEERDVPWGQPEYYYVYSQYGQFRVHYSRCLIFKNGEVPEYTAAGFYRFFGIPEFLKIKDFMREVINGHHDGIKLLERSVLGVYKMKNLSTLLATDEGEDKVIQRLQVIDMARNIINSMAIDADGEDYSYINASMAGASDLIDRTCNMLSSVTDIPQTILFGRSPAGMDATGDNDMENYYQLLARIQRTNLKDNAEKVISLILQEMIRKGEIEEGDVPEYEVRFVPFKQMTEQEQAAIDQQKAATEATKAQTADIYVQMQALDPSEVRKALAETDDYELQGLVDEDNLELPEGSMDLGQGEAGAPAQVSTDKPPAQVDHYDEDIGWRTLKGQQVYLGDNPQDIKAGNPKVVGKESEKKSTKGTIYEEGPDYETGEDIDPKERKNASKRTDLTPGDYDRLKEESGWPKKVLKQFHYLEEYNAMLSLGLTYKKIGDREMLIPKDGIDTTLIDEEGRTYRKRRADRCAPLSTDGSSFTLHHLGQEKDGCLIMISEKQHQRNHGILHGFKKKSEVHTGTTEWTNECRRMWKAIDSYFTGKGK